MPSRVFVVGLLLLPIAAILHGCGGDSGNPDTQAAEQNSAHNSEGTSTGSGSVPPTQTTSDPSAPPNPSAGDPPTKTSFGPGSTLPPESLPPDQQSNQGGGSLPRQSGPFSSVPPSFIPTSFEPTPPPNIIEVTTPPGIPQDVLPNPFDATDPKIGDIEHILNPPKEWSCNTAGKRVTWQEFKTAQANELPMLPKDPLVPAKFWHIPEFFFAGDPFPFSSPPIPMFQKELTIPPVLIPTHPINGITDYYEISMRQGTTEEVPGTKTALWGFDGVFPGPTICEPHGRYTVMRMINDLPDKMIVHRHGGDQPGRFDGQPADASYIEPGKFYDYYYANVRTEHAYWYHEHTEKLTELRIYRGMAGMYITEGTLERDLNLPIGDQKVPLVISDKIFNEDGSLHFPQDMNTVIEGVMGDTILVNGKPWPYMKVGTKRMRFNILNASTSRIYQLALSNGQPLIQLGGSAGLYPAPVYANVLEIGPAERLDVVLDFSTVPVGTRIELQNLMGSGPTAHIMRFDVERQEGDTSSVPPVLMPQRNLNPKDAVAERTFVFSRNVDHPDDLDHMWLINGKGFKHDESMATVKKGTVEIWDLVNTSGQPHPFHMHLVNFQILSRNFEVIGERPAGTYSDMVMLNPGQTVKIIAQFPNYTGKFVLHCHNSVHEDHSMMARFDVVD